MELLSGKCQRDYEDWLVNRAEYKNIFWGINYQSNTVFMYSDLPLSMQFGVIRTFAFSVGVWFEISPTQHHEPFVIDNVKPWHGYVATKDLYRPLDFYDTEEKARESAIKEFNRLYNES